MKKLLLLLLAPAILISSEKYWQQYVHYKIHVKLNPKTNILTGSETLVYKNNSPDDLDRVYFRLYWNVFKKGSHGWKKSKRLKMRFRAPKNYKGVIIKKFAVVRNLKEVSLKYKVDDTILEAFLPEKLKSGESITFKIEWEEEVPPPGMRTGHARGAYDIAQWYPQIAVYDKYGWHKDQYIGMGEFYNDYGTFEVEIEVPKSFIVAASGRLLNPEEVLPSDVLRNLQKARENPGKIIRIADFSDRKITDEERKTFVVWRFKADSVRDFAWSACERYIWDAMFWKNDAHPYGGVMVHALYFKSNESAWKDSAVAFGYHAIKFFSENFGLYLYPNAYVMASYAVGGGMEYPGIVFIGYSITNTPYRGLFGVIVHELGHQWYPMMIGSNETEFAFMDEGFNTFITTLATEAYYGRYKNLLDQSKWFVRSMGHIPDSRENNQRSYFMLAKTGYEEDPIATHADHWLENGPATTAFYPKTATVMFMLQYVLGDKVFSKLMKEYYNRWKFKHPYPEDFYKLAMEVSGRKDLRWFFDEWFHRTYTCDYAVEDVDYEKKVSGGKEIYLTRIKICRKGRAVMPVDILIKMADGSKKSVWVPVDLWLNDEREREVTVELPSKPKYVEINPDIRIADINRLNNTYPFPKFKVSFDNTISMSEFFAPLDAYWVRLRPSIWYNIFDGFKFGLRGVCSYLVDVRALKAWVLFGLKSKAVDFYINARRRLPVEIGRNMFASFRLFKIEGRLGAEFGFLKRFSRLLYIPPFHDVYFKVSFMRLSKDGYVRNLYRWDRGNLVRTLFRYNYSNRWNILNINFGFSFESSTMLSDFNYSKVSAWFVNDLSLPGRIDFVFRLFAGYGSGRLPNQVKYFLASSSPVERFWKPVFRSRIFPDKIARHLHDVGGANLRGYVFNDSSGDRVYAFNAELRFPVVIPSLFRVHLFFDAGKVWGSGEGVSFDNILWDAGFGFELSFIRSVSRFTNILSEVGIRTVRFDFPVYVSRPGSGRKFSFRWVVGFDFLF